LLLEHFKKKEEEGCIVACLPATKEVKGAKALTDVRQGTRALAQTQAVRIDALLYYLHTGALFRFHQFPNSDYA